MNFVLYSLIYTQAKFCLDKFKSLKFTATLSWSPPFFPLKNASVFYTALMGISIKRKSLRIVNYSSLLIR